MLSFDWDIVLHILSFLFLMFTLLRNDVINLVFILVIELIDV